MWRRVSSFPAALFRKAAGSSFKILVWDDCIGVVNDTITVPHYNYGEYDSCVVINVVAHVLLLPNHIFVKTNFVVGLSVKMWNDAAIVEKRSIACSTFSERARVNDCL